MSITIPPRRAFTVIELVAAFTMLGVALLLIAQLGVASVRERARGAERLEILEALADVLEAARVLPWDDLTPEWATAQQLPASLAERLYEGKLSVRVEPEKDAPRVKRLTATVTWTEVEGQPRSRQLVGLFAPRTAAAQGEKP